MNTEVVYEQYLKKLEKLKNALTHKSWDSNLLQLKLSEIIEILKKRGITASDDLLDNDLLEKLSELYDKNKCINDLYTQIFLSLYFKGKSSKKLREEFLPIYFSKEKEREPNKRETLYDKIITLQYYEYNEYKENPKSREHFFKTFQQKFNEIKNYYNRMLREKVDDDFHHYDKFDKDFFEGFMDILNDINQEIYGNKKQKNNNNSNKKAKINIHDLNIVKGIPINQRTFFYNKERLIYGEDMQIEYKNYSFPFTDNHKEEFKKQICGFLNSKGGRIFIGINDDKIVNGILMKYHDRDKNTNEIVNLTYDFYPKCRTCIDVIYIPIKNKDNNYINNLYVVKIIVSQGETNQLYSFTTKGFNSYLRLKGQCINLTAEEIRNELFKREKNPENKINKNEFKDPEPDNPELMKITDSLEKQFRSMTLNNPNKVPANNNIHPNSQIYNKNINKHIINYIDNDSDDENEDFSDFDEEEEEEEEEEKDDILSRGRGSRGRRGNRGGIKEGSRGGGSTGKERGGKMEGNIGKENNQTKKNNKYTVKVYIILKTNKMPNISEIKSNFKNCRKKFLIKGKQIYGYLNFNTSKLALSFIQNFNCNKNPTYEIKLIPRF